MVALVSEISKLDALRDDTRQPPLPELAIALAGQQNLARATKARVDHLNRLIAIREEQLDALILEFEMLVLAHHSVLAAKQVQGCQAKFFAEVLTIPPCQPARYHAAQALVAFTTGWAGGGASARAANMKAVHERRALEGQVAIENAAARQKVIQIALEEIAAFGAGGVKPETIMQLLQVIGLGAIARGVN